MPSPSAAAKAEYTRKVENAKQRAAPLRLSEKATLEFARRVQSQLDLRGTVLLPPMEVKDTLHMAGVFTSNFDVIMLDPWYNKGFGGMQEDYQSFYLEVLKLSGAISQHVYFWGFPEIVAPFVERIPKPLQLTCWLTWYYKNNPSVIRGWRSSQNACLHLSREGAPLFPQRFLNHKQLTLLDSKKLRYMPGPTSVLEGQPDDVIEEPLLVGFVGRKEQTGHPSQKPVRVYDELLRMAVPENGLVLDPMAGSGTTGVVTKKHRFQSILSDRSEEFIQMMEGRLQVERLDIVDLLER